MNSRPDPKQDEISEEQAKLDASWRTTVNLSVAIFCIILFAGGYFLLIGIDKMKKAQICLESGNKSCQRIEPSR